MAKKSQTELVLEYMLANGSITTRQAFTDLGITRLSARIWDLRHKHGVVISDYTIRVPRRNGETAQVKKYYIKQSQLHLAIP